MSSRRNVLVQLLLVKKQHFPAMLLHDESFKLPGLYIWIIYIYVYINI